MGDTTIELARLRRERDLYRRLLTLGERDDVDTFLRDALALIVEATDALQGYLELHNDGKAEWWIAHGLTTEEVEGVQGRISRGIIAEAIATGNTVVTPSALLDPRFGARESVRLSQIEAVLCAPIGASPPRGVVYLQGDANPDFFSGDQRECAELFARHLAPLVDRVLARQNAASGGDPTGPFRASLRLDDVVGRSPALAEVLRQVAMVAPLDVNVLLSGDSGTGKSQLARVIHDNGPRSGRPYVELNCAGIPETLVESELFGAEAGAHSTATRRKEGKIAAAEGGTLFLDEVGELPLAAQGALLQVLQSREYFALGATQPRTADVRVIAASNADLAAAIAERRFREDLFYRLQVLPIRVPTLAERREDVALLARHVAERVSRQHGLPHLDFSPNTIDALESAEWPGNVRQLAHAVEAAVIRAAGERAQQVEPSHVFPDRALPAVEASGPTTFQSATRRFQARLLREALDKNDWNVVETAKHLDIARSHVYNLIRAFGLDRDRSA